MSFHPSARKSTLRPSNTLGGGAPSTGHRPMPPPMSKRLLRRKLLNTLPNLVPIAVYFAHVLLAPYTKVEESFTLHAVHDVLAHGLLPGSLDKVCPPFHQADLIYWHTSTEALAVGPYHLSWSCTSFFLPSRPAWSSYISVGGAQRIARVDQNQGRCTGTR